MTSLSSLRCHFNSFLSCCCCSAPGLPGAFGCLFCRDSSAQHELCGSARRGHGWVFGSASWWWRGELLGNQGNTHHTEKQRRICVSQLHSALLSLTGHQKWSFSVSVMGHTPGSLSKTQNPLSSQGALGGNLKYLKWLHCLFEIQIKQGRAIHKDKCRNLGFYEAAGEWGKEWGGRPYKHSSRCWIKRFKTMQCI